MPLSRLMMKVKSTVSVILRNMEEERELLDGLHALDPDSDAYKPYTLKYRGWEKVIHPSTTMDEWLLRYEIKWRELLRFCELSFESL